MIITVEFLKTIVTNITKQLKENNPEEFQMLVFLFKIQMLKDGRVINKGLFSRHGTEFIIRSYFSKNDFYDYLEELIEDAKELLEDEFLASKNIGALEIYINDLEAILKRRGHIA